MRQPTSEDIRAVMQRFFKSRSVAFTYTMHVSYWGGLDTMELVAYDTDHDLYLSVTISYEEVYAATDFGQVYGKAISALFDAVVEHEAYYLKNY